MKIFIGMDSRQPVAGMVLMSSIMRHQSKPTELVPLFREQQSQITRVGLTGFTFLRYMVPWYCGYQGKALFLDGDMIATHDITEILDAADGSAVQVVKAQKRFEWPSLMLFDCEECQTLTPEYVETENPQTLDWANSVGNLDERWNFCVGYKEKPEQLPYVIHYTAGIPLFAECRGCDYAEIWQEEYQAMMHSVSWIELMGTSVHAKQVLNNLQKMNGGKYIECQP